MTSELRPIEAADADRLRRFHRRLSELSVYQRFHSPHPELSDREVRYFVGADGHAHVAWVACDEAGEIHGVCRVEAHEHAHDEGDIGIVVDDASQGCGIGHALLQRVLEEAAGTGFRSVDAMVLADNSTARSLFISTARDAGIDWRATISSGVVDLRFDLTPLAAPALSR